MAKILPTLDKLDPIEAWQPWQPSPADSWRKWAAHLYRRAAFGPSRSNLLEAVQIGYEGTLNLLLNGKSQTEEIQDTLNDVGRIALAHEGNGEEIRSWWLYCMLQTHHPLREKMTLFWHNHFATSINKVQSADMMFQQNCLLRTHALGKFGPFLQAMSKNEAMLVWLDSNSNIKGKPNENYARELMELFSLGVGNYTEKDIREAARAFTGWHTGMNGFRFDASSHDDGIKTFLGQTGKWDGADVVRIVLEQPAAAQFLVRKLYQFLIAENASPPNAFIEPLCDRLRKSDYDMGDLVKTMLSSRHFYSDHAFRQRIKSPVEYVLGAVQAVYRHYEERETDYRPLPQKVFVSHIGAMGQNLFAPPNVKGWPGARAWLNTSTMLERDNFAAALALGTLWARPSPPTSSERPPAKGGIEPKIPLIPVPPTTSVEPPPAQAFDPARLLQEEKVNSPEDIVRVLLDLYVPGGIRPEAKAKLVAFLTEGKPTGLTLDRRVRETVHAILTMPEYQLA